MLTTKSFLPLDSNGNIITGKKKTQSLLRACGSSCVDHDHASSIEQSVNQEKQDDATSEAADQARAQERERAFHSKLHHIEELIKALGSQGVGCSHVHHTHKTEEDIDEEDQNFPTLSGLEIEEAEDFAIKAGKVGEIITSIGGALAIGPVLDLLVMLIDHKASESVWWLKINPDLQVSPAILLVSLALVIPAAYGAPHCHAQLEIASRTRDNFLIMAKYAQKLLKWRFNKNLEINAPLLAMPTIKVGGQEIAIDEFTLLPPSEATPLSFKQKIQIIGDVEQHFNEYVGLSIIAILRNIKNPIVQLTLTALCLLIAAKACQPEVTTCANTLIFMNSLKDKKIINNPGASNKANWETKFSAMAKFPAVFYASLLSFQQICFGNFYAGLVLALLATKGNIITQYFINANTQAIGESQHKELANTSEITPALINDERSAWEKLSFLGKELVVSRAFGTGNERSEPITISIIALTALAGAPLSPAGQAILALCLCLAGTITAYSEARNAAEHTARIGFFNKPLLVKLASTPAVSEDQVALLGSQF